MFWWLTSVGAAASAGVASTESGIERCAVVEIARPLEAPAPAVASAGASTLDGPAPGCWYQEVEKGPRLGTALAALVKLAPGATFPDHRHVGHERALVLQGAYRSRAGRAAVGDLHEMDEGTSHELTAEPDGEVYYLAVVEGGVEVAGQLLQPAR